VFSNFLACPSVILSLSKDGHERTLTGTPILRQAQDDMVAAQDDMVAAQDDMVAAQDDMVAAQDERSAFVVGQGSRRRLRAGPVRR